MRDVVSHYDPEKEHPEILNYKKKHHHRRRTEADDYDSSENKSGKKNAAKDF
jgi:hypothetical protein